MKISGTVINYYFHCRRQCWLFANRINMEDNSEDVRIGKVLHELKLKDDKQSEVLIGNIRVDKLTNEYLVELKKSDADVEAVKWQTLYYLKVLKEKGIERNGKIIFHEKKKQTRKILYVELTEEIEISTAGVVVHFFNYYGHYTGTFYPREQLVSGRLTIMQAKAYEERRMDIAKAIVNGIADNMHYTLYHYYKHGKNEVRPFLDWLKKDVPNYLQKDLNIKQVLFIEGDMWRKFYESFQFFLPETFLVNKRVKRPPDNPMNALISFGNSILYSKTISQIYRTHLNQTISFLHEPAERRFSLSLDLSEVFKPIIVYRTIFDNVNNRKLQVEKHFDKSLNYAMLNESGRKIFIQSLEERFDSVVDHPRLKRKVSMETAIRLDAYKLIKCVSEGQDFRPFSIRESM